MAWDQVDCQDKIGVFKVKEENSERVRIVRFDLSIAIFLVFVRNLSHWGFFVVMHCGFLA